eukprot:619719-Alexandrium_andersonii.AAC.1
MGAKARAHSNSSRTPAHSTQDRCPHPCRLMNLKHCCQMDKQLRLNICSHNHRPKTAASPSAVARPR